MYNLLNLALSVIRPVYFSYQPFIGSRVNALGVKTPSYGTSVQFRGSLQPVDSATYKMLNLDMMKEYKRVWIPNEVRGIDRKNTPDRIIFDGMNYNVIHCIPWHHYDGWNEVVVVREKEYTQDIIVPEPTGGDNVQG